MARHAKGTAAKRVGQRARERREAQEQGFPRSAAPIAGESGRGSRVERSGDALLLILPRANEPEREDLSFLEQLPELTPLLAEAVRRYADGGVGTRTRQESIANLRRYFFAYLRRLPGSVAPHDLLDDALWSGFVDFLNQPRPSGEPLRHSTRANALKAVRCILDALRTDRQWADIADRILQHVPRKPWPGRSRKQTPAAVVPLDQFDALVLAADEEFRNLRERRKEGKQLLDAGDKKLATGARNFRGDISLCLAALNNRYPEAIPSLAQIKADDRRLGNAVQIHGVNVLAKYLYFSCRDLVPLVLLLAARTSFNPEVTLTLKWSDVSYREMASGHDAIRLAPYKARAGREQVKFLEAETHSPDGLRALFDLILTMTARIRPAIPEGHRDRLFVFMPEKASKTPRAFYHAAGPANDIVWKWALGRFIEDHGLQTFTLGQLRPTRASEIFEATGDIVASRNELGHLSARTSWTHYTSDAVRRRQLERVGQVLLARERWAATEGRIDPRDGRPDPGAATPGFLCLDPHDSPRAGQSKGRPCTAYGECAACPLAGVRNDITAAAQYLGVRDAILAGQHAMASQTWIAKWAPILHEHNAMLDSLESEIVARAHEIKFSYPAVG